MPAFLGPMGTPPGTDSRYPLTETVVEINTALCNNQLSLKHSAWQTSCKWRLVGAGVGVLFVLFFPFPDLRIYFALKSQRGR